MTSSCCAAPGAGQPAEEVGPQHPERPAPARPRHFRGLGAQGEAAVQELLGVGRPEYEGAGCGRSFVVLGEGE